MALKKMMIIKFLMALELRFHFLPGLCSLPIARAADVEDVQGGDDGYLVPFLLAAQW